MIPGEHALAKKLFGVENVKGKVLTSNAPNPFSIYCKNRKHEGFMGENITGFSASFCNSFYLTPTDTGICLTQNVDINKIAYLRKEYSEFMDAKFRNKEEPMTGGNQNAESTFILQAKSANVS